MKKASFMLIVLFGINSFNQAQNSFYKIYEGPSWEWGWDVSETNDEGYIIVGQVTTSQNEDDIYVIKTNHSGDTLWTRSIGGIENDYGYSIRQTSDKGYIIAGSKLGSLPEATDDSMYLVKLSENGEVMWSNTYGGSENNSGGYVEMTDDNGFIILSFDCLRKTASNGDILWTKPLNYLSSDRYGMGICVTSNGGYAITGNGYWDSFLMKTDSNGDTVWLKSYNYYVDMDCESVKETTDGGYVVVGSASGYHPNGPYASDILMIITDSMGDTLRTRNFGFGYGYSADITNDGGFIITGDCPVNLNTNVFLIKTNTLGDIIWKKTYDFLESEYGYSVKQTSDSGYIVTGRIEYSSNKKTDIFLLKTDKEGNVNGLPTSSISRYNRNDIKVYPNPAGDILNIQRNENSEVLIEILDINGKLIYQKSTADCFVRIDISKYPEGPYIAKLSSDSNIITRLIIKGKSY
jgi:hypothetical protein